MAFSLPGSSHGRSSSRSAKDWRTASGASGSGGRQARTGGNLLASWCATIASVAGDDGVDHAQRLGFE